MDRLLGALLAAGADVGAEVKDGWTALHHAAYEGHEEGRPGSCLLLVPRSKLRPKAVGLRCIMQ